MSHPVNTEIFENLIENYQIYQMIVEEEGNVYPQIRYVIRDENNELVRHDWKSSWSLQRDAKKALNEIINQKFEELSK